MFLIMRITWGKCLLICQRLCPGTGSLGWKTQECVFRDLLWRLSSVLDSTNWITQTPFCLLRFSCSQGSGTKLIQMHLQKIGKAKAKRKPSFCPPPSPPTPLWSQIFSCNVSVSIIQFSVCCTVAVSEVAVVSFLPGVVSVMTYCSRTVPGGPDGKLLLIQLPAIL